MRTIRHAFLTGLLFVVAAILTGGLARRASAMPTARGLSLTQIVELVHIHTPDHIVAEAIRSRGLDFTPTAKTLERLQKDGAGQATLAALRERMPIGTLEIDAAPGSQVALDGIGRGSAGAQGRLVLSGVPAGTHELSVSMPNYQPADVTVTLGANEYKRVPARLEWAGGYLTVLVNRPGSAIEIPGLGQYTGSVSNLPCLAQTYDITVTHPGLESQTRSVTVSTGQRAIAQFDLAADPNWVAGLLRNADELRSGGDINGAVQKAKEVLAVDPANGAARQSVYNSYLRGGLLALRASNWWGAFNYFHNATELDPATPGAWGGLGSVDLALGRAADLTSAWNNSLRLGGYIQFAVWHEVGLGSETGTFRMTASEVSFVNGRGMKEFAVPPAQVKVMGAYLTQAAYYFRLRVGRRNYNFYFVPLGVACQVVLLIQCPPQGVAQQQTVANYVAQAIRTLASGGLR